MEKLNQADLLTVVHAFVSHNTFFTLAAVLIVGYLIGRSNGKKNAMNDIYSNQMILNTTRSFQNTLKNFGGDK